MKKYELFDKRAAKGSLANVEDLEWIKYGDTYVAGDDSIGEYIDQVFDTLVGDLSEANDAIEVLNKITKHLEKDPPKRGEEREKWFDEIKTLTSQAGITVSFKYGQDWEKQIKDAVKEQEDQIFRDNVQTYNWFQKINQDESIDAVKEALYDMSPEGFTDAIKNSTQGFGKETIAGVKFENIADPQFAEFVYEQEGTSQLGLEVSRFIGKPPKPPEPPVDAAQKIKGIDARIPAQKKEIDVGAISQSLAGTGVADLVGADDSALVAQKQIEEQAAQQKEYEDLAGFVGMFGGEAPPPVGSDVADTETPQSETPQTSIPPGPSAADLIAQSKANEDEVYALLQEQFGGASYFFRNNARDMQIGVTADGTIVSYDDESREKTIPLMDYIVDNGITSITRVKGLLQKTEWWQTTDVARRTYDVMWGEMSDPERVEFLQPTTDALTKEAQFLGFDLDGDVAFTLAQKLAQNGDSEDVEAIREMIIGQFRMQDVVSELSGFETQKDNLRQLARNYYAPLPEQGEGSIEQWAELIYTGESTADAYEQNLKQIAVSRFPTLDKVIREMGLTPQQYFAPYKQQIENMLGRNVDLYNEFSDVIEYIPDGGTDARAMTLSEVQNFVRALPEWQQTDDAKDRARALAFSIGQTFGEVA